MRLGRAFELFTSVTEAKIHKVGPGRECPPKQPSFTGDKVLHGSVLTHANPYWNMSSGSQVGHENDGNDVSNLVHGRYNS